MEISDFPWLPLEFSESTVFSILALHIVSRMRSHVFLVADLIDPYLSPRCITQNMALARFFLSALCHAHLDDNGRYRLDLYPLCVVHNNTPLAVVTHITPSCAILSTPSGAGCVATHK